MKILFFWLRNARWVALPQSLLPALIAFSLAAKEDGCSYGYALLAIVGVCLAHLSCNLWDDYFDYKKGVSFIREQLSSSGMRARVGKCDYLTSGKATIQQLRRVASLFAFIALCCGVVVFFKRGLPILWIASGGALLGFFYSAPPVQLSYRGWGEIAVIFLFGPLLMSGVYLSATGFITPALWFISIPIGLLVANILYTHDIMDLKADRQMNKKTLCVRLNHTEAILFVSALFIFLPYLILLIGVVVGYLSVWMFLPYITLPQAIALFVMLSRFINSSDKQIKPYWWMKPMERWEDIEKAGIAWFMIRWYLSRNLLIYFGIAVIISYWL